MRSRTKLALGVVGFFVLVIFAGAVYEVQKESEVKNAKTVPYTIVKFEDISQPTTKRFHAFIIAKTTDKSQIELVVKKEILRIKEQYGAGVIWVSIYPSDKAWNNRESIAEATWYTFSTEHKPYIDERAENIGSFSGGELWILWQI